MEMERLHPSIELTLVLANQEAQLSGYPLIEPEHFFLALLRMLDDSFLQEAEERKCSADYLEQVQEAIRVAKERVPVSPDQVTRMRRKGTLLLRKRGVQATPHFLQRSPASRELFRQGGVMAGGEEAFRLEHLVQLFCQRGCFSSLEEMERQFQRQAPPQLAQETTVMNGLGRDLVALAAQKGRLPLVGREREMTQLLRYLQRTTKRNTLLIGEAGVGKTAIVEGIAWLVSQKRVPEDFQNVRIVQVQVSDLIAGTSFRGDMEMRVKSVLDEAASDPNMVLFLDEMHLVVGGGMASGSPIDLANILKTALTSESFRCIGATTVEEYERIMKNDAAFLRRFQVLRVEQPTREEAIAICEAWAKRIADIQGITFSQGVVPFAVDLSVKHLPSTTLPDKAIDVLENAAVRVKIRGISPEGYSRDSASKTVTKDTIISVLEEQYGVWIQREERIRPARISEELKKVVFGQDAALETLCNELIHVQRPHGERKGPMGVLLFQGPTGTGKTFTAEKLGNLLFPQDPGCVVRFGMNEYKERHDLAKLVGAAPGLVGHDRQGALFEYASVHPQGLLILDEMEKAHEEIQDFFLQLFDNGEARDSRGKRVDFGHHLFILTCNAESAGPRMQIGFTGSQYSEEPSPLPFRSEFLGRIQRIIPFREFVAQDYALFLQERLRLLQNEARGTQTLRIVFPEEAQSRFIELCCARNEGYRGFEKTFQQYVAIPLGERGEHLSHNGEFVVELPG